MSTNMQIAALIFVVCLIGLSIACEVKVWNECRAKNSWFYCMRVLGK